MSWVGKVVLNGTYEMSEGVELWSENPARCC